MAATEGLRLAEPGEPGVSLMALAYNNSRSVVKSGRAMSCLIQWAIAVRDLGHELGEAEGGHLSAAVREYTRYWRQSERTSWRDIAAWRASFPGEESPASIARQLVARHELKRGPAGQGAIGQVLVVA